MGEAPVRCGHAMRGAVTAAARCNNRAELVVGERSVYGMTSTTLLDGVRVRRLAGSSNRGRVVVMLLLLDATFIEVVSAGDLELHNWPHNFVHDMV
ncbi:hypothetical protein M8818_004506 [Zalaria obscura]|uniref:Uncharacterized protein n=1 Tax=Zalaria obscura TaxID=2024903 RepID=A0ACC3SC92_9PEZI